MAREPRLRVCTTCHKGLKNGRLPQLAIANNFAIGWLPEAMAKLEPTDMEWALAQPVHHVQYLLTFNHKTRHMVPSKAAPNLTGPQAMQGHLHAARLNAPVVAEALPHRMGAPPVRVVVDGCTTEKLRQHHNWLRRFACVRRSVVRALVAHGIAHNHNAYAEFTEVNEENAATLPEYDDEPEAVVQHCVASTESPPAGSAEASDEESGAVFADFREELAEG